MSNAMQDSKPIAIAKLFRPPLWRGRRAPGWPMLITLLWFCVGWSAANVFGDEPAAPVPAIWVKHKAASGQIREVTGRKIVGAADGGILLMTDDGQMLTLQPENTLDVRTDVGDFVAATADQVVKRLGDELTAFETFRTQNYILAYNGSQRHARSVGQLLEQTHRTFFNFWKGQGLKLEQPEWPLVALVFKNRDDYLAYATEHNIPRAGSLLGFYNLSSNRIITYNVPNWERNLATIVHEATHQLAFNTGLQKRECDNPVWASEGIAMFFEAVDLKNTNSFRGVGRVNNVNLKRWWKYFKTRPADSLSTLIGRDDRLYDEGTVADAYGESWALTYFLLRTRGKQYIKYLQLIREGKPVIRSSPRERIAQFEQAMGTSIEKLDLQFIKYMRRVNLQ